MSARDRTQYAYAKVTRLSDDFKRLEHTPTPTYDVGFTRPIDYCIVCLGHFRETRTLACQHRYCRECLQLSIDSAPVIPDPDRGFECVLCGYFTKVPNYSIARTEWATLMTSDYLQQQLVTTVEETEPGIEQVKDTQDEYQDVQTNEWSLVWQISAYPRSYLRTRRLNPFKRTRNAYIYVENQEDATARTDAECTGKDAECTGKDAECTRKDAECTGKDAECTGRAGIDGEVERNMFLPALSLGLDDVITVPVMGTLFHLIKTRFKSGNIKEAQTHQVKALRLRNINQKHGGGIAVAKATFELMSGIPMGGTRLPLHTVTEATRENLRADLEEGGFLRGEMSSDWQPPSAETSSKFMRSFRAGGCIM